MKPSTDNCIARMGWIEYSALAAEYDLHVSIDPDGDLDGVVIAFDHDEQEMIHINGWMFEFEPIQLKG